MKTKFIFSSFLLYLILVKTSLLVAQKSDITINEVAIDTLSIAKTSDTEEKLSIRKYQRFSLEKDTTHLDTLININKLYKFNYLRKDDFALLPMNNVAQPYVDLQKKTPYEHSFPSVGAKAKNTTFWQHSDLRFYKVPTPLTELYFNTTFEQGQQLESFFTINTAPNFNFSIDFKAMRSVGKYTNALSNSTHFNFTAWYHTLDKRYDIRAAYTNQNIENEENGGFSTLGKQTYLDTDSLDASDYAQRSALDVVFSFDTDIGISVLNGKRWYVDQSLGLLKKVTNDTLKKSNADLRLGYEWISRDKTYRYTQGTVNSLIYGNAYQYSGSNVSQVSSIQDKAALDLYEHIATLRYSRANTHLRTGLNYRSATYTNELPSYYNSFVSTDNSGVTSTVYPRKDIQDIVIKQLNFVTRFNTNIFKTNIALQAQQALGNDNYDGYLWKLNLDKQFHFSQKDSLRVHLATKLLKCAPDFNELRYQSDYNNYNWENDLNSIKTNKVSLGVSYNDIVSLQASLKEIQDYTYFIRDEFVLSTTVEQHQEKLQHLQLKGKLNYHIGKFYLDATLAYQKVNGNDDNIYNIPDFITRTSLYYRNYLFSRALLLEAGATYRYHTDYYGDGYDPVLGEFYVQDQEKIGGFSQVDLFVTGKISQTRVFFKVENFSELFVQNRQFSVINYGYRDAIIRFGLVWNFLM